VKPPPSAGALKTDNGAEARAGAEAEEELDASPPPTPKPNVNPDAVMPPADETTGTGVALGSVSA